MNDLKNKYNHIGKGYVRKDGAEKVTGTAVYVHDLAIQGMLYAKTVISPHAYARIKGIDTGEALKIPGVRAVVTGKSLITRSVYMWWIRIYWPGIMCATRVSPWLLWPLIPS